MILQIIVGLLIVAAGIGLAGFGAEAIVHQIRSRKVSPPNYLIIALATVAGVCGVAFALFGVGIVMSSSDPIEQDCCVAD